MKRQAGFTLIELIMVIVILGILSAFAIPRFADLSGNARSSAIQGLEGALKSAASIARASQLANSGALGSGVTLDGTAITMVNGYPTADAAGIVAAAAITASDFVIDATTTAAATGGASIVFRPIGGTSATCQVTYTAANAATDNTAPITAPATIVSVTNGC